MYYCRNAVLLINVTFVHPPRLPLSLACRAARCLIFNWTIWYFGFLSSIKMTVISDNAWVNSSIFCQCSVFWREPPLPTRQPYSHVLFELVCQILYEHFGLQSRQ